MTRVVILRIALCLLWLLAAGGGFALLLDHQNGRGRAGVSPEHWPSGTHLTLSQDRNTLVMFAHPRCPCTRASVEELNRVLAQAHEKVFTQVCFFKPEGVAADWTHTDLWRTAAAIEGVTAQEDSEGAEARRFGAETSGHVLLYDADGKLLFKGGITGSRGHVGDNAGEAALISLLAGHKSELKQTPVYGCTLLSDCKSVAKAVAQ